MPRQRQTRVRQQLVCRQIARLAAVEDCLGDVAEANDAGEIGGLTPARLASAAKDMSALLHECGVEQVRPDPDFLGLELAPPRSSISRPGARSEGHYATLDETAAVAVGLIGGQSSQFPTGRNKLH